MTETNYSLPCIVTKYKSGNWIATHKRDNDRKFRKALAVDHSLSSFDNAKQAAKELIKSWDLGAATVVSSGHDSDNYFFICQFY